MKNICIFIVKNIGTALKIYQYTYNFFSTKNKVKRYRGTAFCRKYGIANSCGICIIASAKRRCNYHRISGEAVHGSPVWGKICDPVGVHSEVRLMAILTSAIRLSAAADTSLRGHPRDPRFGAYAHKKYNAKEQCHERKTHT